MNPDPLSELRDIHLPQQAGLPLSFYIVALASMLLIVMTGMALKILWRRRNVKADALRLLQDASELPDQESLLAQAKLLRRLANTVGDGKTTKSRGRAWLKRLDALFVTDFFTAGAGQIFGEALYRRQGASDAPAVAAKLRQLIGQLKC